jgi:hypothetical protein
MHVDGNAIGGLLMGVFGHEATDASGTCRNCGTESFVGALLVYRAAGVVARCPTCAFPIMKVVEGRDELWIDLDGLLGSGLEPLREARVHVVHAREVVDGGSEL